MDKSWMGRYRELVAQLVRHSNVCARKKQKKEEKISKYKIVCTTMANA